MLSNGLGATHEMREFASSCRSLVRVSDYDGVGSLLLFAYYMESQADIRESSAVDADRHMEVMPRILQCINDCLTAIERGDLARLGAHLDSFARSVSRVSNL